MAAIARMARSYKRSEAPAAHTNKPGTARFVRFGPQLE
jgi:hypothetical protein